MASRKRFIDADIFADEWFIDLEPKYKLAWIFLLTNCGHDGIWKVSQKLLSFNVGENVEIVGLKRALSERVVELEKGRLWFFPKFITFQYGANLSRNNNTLKQFFEMNEKYDLLKYIDLEAPPEGLLGGAQVKDKDKVKDKVKDKEDEIKEPSVDEVRGHLEGEYEKNASRFSPLTRSDLGRIADMYIISRNRNDWKDIHEKPITRWKRDCEAYAFYTAANGGIKKKPGNGEQITENKKDKLEWLK